MVFRVLSCQWNGAASAIPDLLRKLNAFPSQRLEGIAALTDMGVQAVLVVTPTRRFMPSLIAMPRSWLRAARLTMRQQRMKPSNLAEWVAVFKQKLRHPGQLPAHVRAPVEAENWAELERLVDDVDPYFFEGLRAHLPSRPRSVGTAHPDRDLLPVGVDRPIDSAAFALGALHHRS
jgi:hypothetical protein